jgi:hypothetical protein
MQHITVPLPDGISPSVARRLAVEIEGQVSRRTGALVEAEITDLILTDQERRVICSAIDVAVQAAASFGNHEHLDSAATLIDLRHQLDPDARSAVVAAALRETNGHQELTRQQECAADAMAAEYGRSRVRHLSDGAVVIVGMTDDVERAQRCVERDGRERWRS